MIRREREPGATRPERILIVASQAELRSRLARHFDATGYAIESIAARDAMPTSADAAHLVIVEGSATDASGVSIACRLKTEPATAALPVIAIGDQQEPRIACLNAGVEAFLPPGVDRTELLARVGGLLRASCARQIRVEALLHAAARRKSEIRRTFRRYLSPGLVDRLLSDSRASLQAPMENIARMHAVVLFADMRGFTALSERLAPSEVVPLLNQYFGLLSGIVLANDGTLFHMAGDGLMAGFGVPAPQRDGAVRAGRTAREMLERFAGLARSWKAQHSIDLGIGIGINEGEVIAGNIGCPAFMSYTIIGDVVNVASRLVQRARSGEVLFSRQVMRSLDAAGYDIGAIELPPLVLRGRAGPVDIYCVPAPTRIDVRASL